MRILRTPDERFATLPDFDHRPGYAEVPDPSTEGATLRMAYVAVGPADGPVVLALHGDPTWGFLYRKVIAALADTGVRVVVPDLIGFGRSDKPADVAEHTYARHVEWVRALVFDALDLRKITLLGQDWGGLLGLRLVAEHPDRFARVVAANTGLPDGTFSLGEEWWAFHDFVARTDDLPVGLLVQFGSATELPDEVVAAYDAPYPDARYKAGPKAMPDLIPQTPDDVAAAPAQAAWDVLRRFEGPFLCAFSDGDPITRGADALFTSQVPGCAGQPHTTIAGAGHFLQEDKGEDLARVVVDWLRGLGVVG
jgi:haloalkane dehalogenase